MNIDINSNAAEIRARLQKRIDNLHDVRTTLLMIAAQLFRSVQENFETQSSDVGKKWKPLSPATIYAKMHRRKKRTVKFLILQDMGTLKQSNYQKVEKDYARVSNNLLYAPFQHFGTRFIPKRAFLTIRRDALGKIKSIARRWVYMEGK